MLRLKQQGSRIRRFAVWASVASACLVGGAVLVAGAQAADGYSELKVA